ncbi:GNAT family N-acetyltransferase, partial [bacterium]|nr:GNAT family N-acetyltransferase [candidate division CSSED10-310 bacterium]
MSNHQTFQLRLFKDTDLTSVNRLFTSVFGIKRSAAAWHWKFQENPHGKSIILLAFSDHDLIGHYALIPRKINLFGSLKNAYQEVDLMINSKYSAGGVFRKMGKHIYNIAGEQDCPFTFGFPNQTSLPAGKRILGWRAIGSIPLFTLLLNPIDFLKNKFSNQEINKNHYSIPDKIYHRIISLRFRSRKKTNQIKIFDNQTVRLLQNINRGKNFYFEREEEYLNWRYFNHPDKNYLIVCSGPDPEPEGVAIFCHSDHQTQIAEFELKYSEDYETAKALMMAIYSDALKRQSFAIRMWMLESDPYVSMLHSLGFSPRDSKIHHVIRSFMDPESNRLIWDPERWYISSGDSDCV